MKIPITQSRAWQTLQDSLGETSFFEQGKGYQYLAILKSTPVGAYLYLPYGPVFSEDQGLKNSLRSLKTLAQRHQAFFVRVEPQSEVFTSHLPQNATKTKDLSPKETWVLDLTGSDVDLKQKLPSRLLRYYKNREKNGIKIETSTDPNDISELLKLQKQLASQKKINTFSEKYLKTELEQPFATLYLAKYSAPDSNQEQTVAAGLVFDDKTTRYNLQGAQSEQGRKLHATGILTIQLILDAKAQKLKNFDFWGIAPEGASANHPWAGFTNFKKTFAGQEVQYSGTYDLVTDPKKYHFYRIFRKINRLFRKI